MRILAMEKIVYIALAGAAGTVTRYGVGTLFQRDGVSGMPWGVFVANMIGALLFGLIWALSEERGWISENMRVIALVGFMGAFTTFSTFAFDNVQMARASEWGWFGANMVLTNVGGLAAIYAGFRIARMG
jgi:CrcB protein